MSGWIWGYLELQQAAATHQGKSRGALAQGFRLKQAEFSQQLNSKLHLMPC